MNGEGFSSGLVDGTAGVDGGVVSVVVSATIEVLLRNGRAKFAAIATKNMFAAAPATTSNDIFKDMRIEVIGTLGFSALRSQLRLTDGDKLSSARRCGLR